MLKLGPLVPKLAKKPLSFSASRTSLLAIAGLLVICCCGPNAVCLWCVCFVSSLFPPPGPTPVAPEANLQSGPGELKPEERC